MRSRLRATGACVTATRAGLTAAPRGLSAVRSRLGATRAGFAAARSGLTAVRLASERHLARSLFTVALTFARRGVLRPRTERLRMTAFVPVRLTVRMLARSGVVTSLAMLVRGIRRAVARRALSLGVFARFGAALRRSAGGNAIAIGITRAAAPAAPTSPATPSTALAGRNARFFARANRARHVAAGGARLTR